MKPQKSQTPPVSLTAPLISREEYEAVLRENTLLASRVETLEGLLDDARRWMKREISNRSEEIKKDLTAKKTLKDLGSLLADTSNKRTPHGVIIDQLTRYFGESLDDLPTDFLAYMIEVERLYYLLTVEGGFEDGLPIISVMTKAYDLLIHELITRSFAPWARKEIEYRGIASFRDPIEWALSKVVTKNFTLSIGRFSCLLGRIHEHRTYGVTLLPYTHLFYEWVEADAKRQEVFERESFRKKLNRLNESEIFGEKRHRSIVQREEVAEARSLLYGHLSERDAVFIHLMDLISK